MTIPGIGKQKAVPKKAYQELCYGLVDLGFSITGK